MGDRTDLINDTGEVVITLDGQNSSVQVQSNGAGDRFIKLDGLNGSIEGTSQLRLVDPSDGSKVTFSGSQGGIILQADQNGGVYVSTQQSGTAVSISTASGVLLKDQNGNVRARVWPHGDIQIYDSNGKTRFEFFNNNLRIADDTGDTTFSVDSQSGDVKHKGTLTKI